MGGKRNSLLKPNGMSSAIAWHGGPNAVENAVKDVVFTQKKTPEQKRKAASMMLLTLWREAENLTHLEDRKKTFEDAKAMCATAEKESGGKSSSSCC